MDSNLIGSSLIDVYANYDLQAGNNGIHQTGDHSNDSSPPEGDPTPQWRTGTSQAVSRKIIDPFGTDSPGESSTESRSLGNFTNKQASITQKIIEYRLYLEQINNERQYVSNQLAIFDKQLESEMSLGVPSAQHLNQIPHTPFGTHPYGELSPPLGQPQMRSPLGEPTLNCFPLRGKQFPSNNLLDYFTQFFTRSEIGEHNNPDVTMVNLMFAAFLVFIGYLLASKPTPK